MRYHVDGSNGYTIRTDEGGKENIIAYFSVKLKKILNFLMDGRIEKKYQLEFYRPEFVGEAEVDVKALDSFDYSSIDDSLLLSPTISTAAKEMAFYIKSQAKDADGSSILYFDKLGWNNIENNHIYCAGNQIISSEPFENFTVADALSKKYRLEIDQNLSERDAVAYAFKLMDVDPPATPIIFVTGLLGVMRQIILDADINTPCLLYVVAPTQCRKTEFAKQSTQLYNRSKIHQNSGVSSLRVSSTEFKTEELVDALKDATFLLDDLYKEPDRIKRKKNEDCVRNLLRNFSDNSSRTTARSSFGNNCQIIVTAEYLLNSKTDVGRMMVLRLDRPVNSPKLAECQKHPLSLSTFYYFFIQWLCRHYDEIVLRLKKKFAQFREEAIQHKAPYERLYEQSFLSQFAFDVFLEYGQEVVKSVNVKAYKSEFGGYVACCLDDQIKVLNHIEAGEKKVHNLSAELVKMLNSGTIIPQKKGSDCFVKNGKLYLCNSYFGKMLSKQYAQPFSAKSIAAYFRDRYISEVYSDNRPKKYGNKCYLILRMEELEKDAAADTSAISQLFF